MAEAKSYQVLWIHTAQQDLTEIVEYIAQDSIGDALAILHKLETKAALLISLPNRGRIVPELLHAGISHYRELVSAPWRIVYRVESRQVLIRLYWTVGVICRRCSSVDWRADAQLMELAPLILKRA